VTPETHSGRWRNPEAWSRLRWNVRALERFEHVYFSLLLQLNLEFVTPTANLLRNIQNSVPFPWAQSCLTPALSTSSQFCRQMRMHPAKLPPQSNTLYPTHPYRFQRYTILLHHFQEEKFRLMIVFRTLLSDLASFFFQVALSEISYHPLDSRRACLLWCKAFYFPRFLRFGGSDVRSYKLGDKLSGNFWLFNLLWCFEGDIFFWNAALTQPGSTTLCQPNSRWTWRRHSFSTPTLLKYIFIFPLCHSPDNSLDADKGCSWSQLGEIQRIFKDFIRLCLPIALSHTQYIDVVSRDESVAATSDRTVTPWGSFGPSNFLVSLPPIAWP